MSPDLPARPGDAAELRARAADLDALAQDLLAAAEALTQVTTGSWTGRAGDRFRERFHDEPARWREAGMGLRRTAAALREYAGALERAQTAGSPEAAHEELEAAAQRAVAEVRRQAERAPQRRLWPESGLRFLGGVVTGALGATGEATRVAAGLGSGPGTGAVADLVEVAGGGPGATDAAARLGIGPEVAAALRTQAQDDPAEVGLRVGRSLDWPGGSDGAGPVPGPGAWHDAAGPGVGDVLAAALGVPDPGGPGSAWTELAWPLDEQSVTDLAGLSLDEQLARVAPSPEWDDDVFAAAPPSADAAAAAPWRAEWFDPTASGGDPDQAPTDWPPRHDFTPGPGLQLVGAAPTPERPGGADPGPGS